VNRVVITQDDFDLAETHAWLKQDEAACGAVVTFTGMVRDLASGDLDGLFLEHYPGMTEQSLAAIIAQARARWALGRVAIHHRIGWLALNDNIVMVGVSAPHRAEAFAAAEFLMDYLKRDAPFWKKERVAGQDHWVEQKHADREAIKRWEP